MRPCALVSIFLLVALAVTAESDTINVPGDYDKIEVALLVADSGDTILIEPGTYHERGLQMKSFVTMKNANPFAPDVVIDADELGRVVDCTNVVYAEFMNITFANGSASRGGAVLLETDGSKPVGASADFIDCAFLSNEVRDSGGAIYCGDGAELYALSCEFVSNSATNDGGAIAVRDSLGSGGCSLGGCTFTDNSAGRYGGALDSNPCAALSLSGCDFDSNDAHYAGALHVVFSDVDFVSSCTFAHNTGDYGAGAVSVIGSACQVSGCTFIANESPYGTFGAPLEMSSAEGSGVAGCTFALNAGTRASGLFVLNTDGVTMERTILAFAPTGVPVSCENCDVTLENCCIDGNEDGNWVGAVAGQDTLNGNMRSDPLFCGMYADDCTLCSNSPCLAANNGVTDIGSQPQGCGECVSPVQPMSWGSIKALYR